MSKSSKALKTTGKQLHKRSFPQPMIMRSGALDMSTGEALNQERTMCSSHFRVLMIS